MTRPCLAPDLPGFGHSSPPTRARITAYADDVILGLRSLGIESFALVGHSFGGAVATAVAERLPESVTRLVLCAPAGFGRLPLAELAAMPLIRPLAVGVVPHIERRRRDSDRLRAAALPSLRLRHPAAAARVRPGLRMAIEALAEGSRSQDAFHRRLGAYRGPVAAVWGDSDGLIPVSHLTRLIAYLPQTEAYLCTGIGHYVHRERALDVAAFLQTATPSGALHPADWDGRDARPRWRFDGRRATRWLTRPPAPARPH